jgi:hypothetical protein
MSRQMSRRKSTTPGMWSIVGGAALVAVAFIFAKNFASLRRYIKIERM